MRTKMDGKGSFLLRRNLILREGLYAASVACFADTVVHGLMLCMMLCLVLPLPAAVTAALPHRVPLRLRTLLYSVLAALVYVPGVLLLQQKCGAAAVHSGLTALTVLITGLLFSRVCPELLMPENYPKALLSIGSLTVGTAFAVMLTAVLRELLGAGTVSGMKLTETPLLPCLAHPACGLILVTLLGAMLLPASDGEEAADELDE